jgi:parvulin-like peptidyl-prolyl isomerase
VSAAPLDEIPLVKRYLPILIVAAFVVAVLAGCGGSSGPRSVPAEDVAVVGDDEVTKAQLDELVTQVKANYKLQGRPFPKRGTGDFDTLQDQMVQYLIQLHEFEQKADDMGVKVEDTEIDKRINLIVKQSYGGNKERFQKALKQQGYTEAAYRQSVHDQLLGQKLSDQLTKEIKIPPRDVKKYYDSHPEYTKRAVRHILVNSKPLADRLYRQLAAGASFAALAKKYSKDPGSASQGGRLEISRGQTVPEFDAKAFALKTGEISKPVKTQFGWHIIQAVSPVKKTPFAQVQPQIREQLSQQKKSDVVRNFIDDTKREFCKGKIAYQAGYAPRTDPCATYTSTTSNATTELTNP